MQVEEVMVKMRRLVLTNVQKEIVDRNNFSKLMKDDDASDWANITPAKEDKGKDLTPSRHVYILVNLQTARDKEAAEKRSDIYEEDTLKATVKARLQST